MHLFVERNVPRIMSDTNEKVVAKRSGVEEIKRGTMINASPAFKPVNHRQVFFYRADTIPCFLSRGARYTPRLFVLVARTKDNDPPLLSKMERNHDLKDVSFLCLQCAILRKPRRE